MKLNSNWEILFCFQLSVLLFVSDMINYMKGFYPGKLWSILSLQQIEKKLNK